MSDSLAHSRRPVGAGPAGIIGVAALGVLLCVFAWDLISCALREKDSVSVPRLPPQVLGPGVQRGAHTVRRMLHRVPT